MVGYIEDREALFERYVRRAVIGSSAHYVGVIADAIDAMADQTAVTRAHEPGFSEYERGKVAGLRVAARRLREVVKASAVRDAQQHVDIS